MELADSGLFIGQAGSLWAHDSLALLSGGQLEGSLSMI